MFSPRDWKGNLLLIYLSLTSGSFIINYITFFYVCSQAWRTRIFNQNLVLNYFTCTCACHLQIGTYMNSKKRPQNNIFIYRLYVKREYFFFTFLSLIYKKVFVSHAFKLSYSNMSSLHSVSLLTNLKKYFIG